LIWDLNTPGVVLAHNFLKLLGLCKKEREMQSKPSDRTGKIENRGSLNANRNSMRPWHSLFSSMEGLYFQLSREQGDRPFWVRLEGSTTGPADSRFSPPALCGTSVWGVHTLDGLIDELWDTLPAKRANIPIAAVKIRIP